MAEVWDPFGNTIQGKDQSRVGGGGKSDSSPPENYSYQWWTDAQAPGGSGDQSRVFDAELRSYVQKNSPAGIQAKKALDEFTAAPGSRAASIVLGTAQGVVGAGGAPKRTLALSGTAIQKQAEAKPKSSQAAQKQPASATPAKQAAAATPSLSPAVQAGIRAGQSQAYAESRESGTTSDGNAIGSDPNGYGSFSNSGNGYGDYGVNPVDAARERDAQARGDYGATYGTYSSQQGAGSQSTPGDCFITTAAVAGHEPDDGPTLTALRWFRDNVMMTSAWRDDVETYYRESPATVARIEASTKRDRIYGLIRTKVLAPCVAAIASGRYEEAYRRYKRMVGFLAKI